MQRWNDTITVHGLAKNHISKVFSLLLQIFLERVLHAQREAVEARIGHQFQMFAPDLNRYVPANA
jgi:hypothetical protein